MIEDPLSDIVSPLVITWCVGRARNEVFVARSSVEAKYRAMTSTTCDLIWLK